MVWLGWCKRSWLVVHIPDLNTPKQPFDDLECQLSSFNTSKIPTGTFQHPVESLSKREEKVHTLYTVSVMVRRSTNTFCILKHPSAVLCCRHYPYITLCSFAKMSQSADKYALIWMRFDRFCMLCHHASHVSTPSFSVFLVFLFFFFFLSSLCHVQEHFQRGSQVLHLFSLSKNSIWSFLYESKSFCISFSSLLYLLISPHR